MEKENEITKPLPPPTYINMKRRKISAKEGYKLAKRNKSVRDWAIATPQTPPTNPPSMFQKEPSISVEEEEELKMLEEPAEVDMLKGQRLAECKAKKITFQTKTICANLVEELVAEMKAGGSEDWEVIANQEMDRMMDRLGQERNVIIPSSILEEEAELEMISRRCEGGTKLEFQSRLGVKEELEMEEWRPLEDMDGMEYEEWLQAELESMNMNVRKDQPDISKIVNCKMDLGLAITHTLSSATTNTLSSATPEPKCSRDDEFGPTVCSTPRTLVFEDRNMKMGQAGVQVQAGLELKSDSSSSIPQVSFSSLTTRIKPKPWHVTRKRGIIPDGLVQTRLNHFRMLTNRKGGGTKQICSTNESPGKRGGSYLNSPKAEKQRRQ